MALWLVAGVALGALFVRLAQRRGEPGDRWILALGLVVAALVYVAFAGLAGDAVDLARAAGGLLAFAAAAHLAARVTSRRAGLAWLAVGWGAHAVWDAALHRAAPAVAPGWYATLCLGFDGVVVAAVLAAGWAAARNTAERVPGAVGAGASGGAAAVPASPVREMAANEKGTRST